MGVITKLGGIFTIKLSKGLQVYEGGQEHGIISYEYRNYDFKHSSLMIISKARYNRFDMNSEVNMDFKYKFKSDVSIQ